MSRNGVSQQITNAFRLAHRASEDDQFSPAARNVFRAIARELWKAHGENAADGAKGGAQ